jgi:hypothetical protein
MENPLNKLSGQVKDGVSTFQRWQGAQILWKKSDEKKLSKSVKQLKTDWTQELPAAIQQRFLRLPVCYTNLRRLKYTEM